MERDAGSVTCAEKVRMNALAGILFVLGGDGIIAVALLTERSGVLGTLITGLFGVAAVFIGLYYMLCYINKKIAVSDDGVVYMDWMGKKHSYAWSEVQVSHHPGRNAYFIFDLNGHRVKFYGYSSNALAMHEYLMANGRYDDDTVNAERKARDEEMKRVKLMQKNARTDASDWDDND